MLPAKSAWRLSVNGLAAAVHDSLGAAASAPAVRAGPAVAVADGGPAEPRADLRGRRGGRLAVGWAGRREGGRRARSAGVEGRGGRRKVGEARAIALAVPSVMAVSTIPVRPVSVVTLVVVGVVSVVVHQEALREFGMSRYIVTHRVKGAAA